MITRRFLTPALLFLTPALCSLVASSLRAAVLNIDDTSPNEVLIYQADGFENFSIDGITLPPGVIHTVPETDTGNVLQGSWFTTALPNPVSGRVYLVEAMAYTPSGPPPILSDIFSYEITPNPTGGPTILNAHFVSSDNLGPLPSGIDPALVYPENGQPVLLDFPFLNLSIVIRSDQVPEPTSCLLAGLGLASVFLTRRIK